MAAAGQVAARRTRRGSRRRGSQRRRWLSQFAGRQDEAGLAGSCGRAAGQPRQGRARDGKRQGLGTPSSSSNSASSGQIARSWKERARE
ncbi:hypothetical protein ZWY2020_012965 [Hordeum vulgare]|nr:hypothetical protein ZWY2020_012965 [Hordeum vulgare]